MSETVVNIIVFVVYLLFMLGIGYYCYTKIHNVSDFILGGRSLNPWVTALSAQASDMSGWLLMGLPGMAYVISQGTSEAIWTAIGLMLGTYLNWWIVAKRLRQYTKVAGDAITLPEFFQNRFRDKSGVIKAISAIFILFFFLFFTASMFSTGARFLISIFNISYQSALLICMAIVVAYTFLGGFLAVCWTDAVQGTLMFFALVVTPIVAYVKIGSQGGLGIMLNDIEGTFNFLPRNLDDGSVNVMLMVSSIAYGLGYFGQPHILPRFMAIRDNEEIRPARIIAIVWLLITLTMAILIGVLGAVLYPELADSQTLFTIMVKDLFHPFIIGVLLTAVLAAIMSSTDSQLLVASSAIAFDIYGGLLNKNRKQNSLLWVNRITVIVISVIATLLVWNPNPSAGSVMEKINLSVFRLVTLSWSGLGSAFGPVVLFSLFWRRTTKTGALLGIITGGLTAFIWWLASGGVFEIHEIIPGFIVSCIVIVVTSLLTEVPKEIEEEFDRVKEEGASA